MILKDAVKNFYRWQLQNGKSPRTAKAYRATLEDLPDQEGDLTGITPQGLMEFLAPIGSPSSRNNKKIGLRSFFRWAVDSGHLDKNPARMLTLERLPQREAPFMTQKEIAKLRQVIKANPRDQLIFEIFIMTGA